MDVADSRGAFDIIDSRPFDERFRRVFSSFQDSLADLIKAHSARAANVEQSFDFHGK